MRLLKKFADASRRASRAVVVLIKEELKEQEAAVERKLAGVTNNFTKAMVVLTYTAKETQIMEDEGSVLLEHGYMMQGQSGFAENRGVSWTSIISANRSKGTTTITYVKVK